MFRLYRNWQSTLMTFKMIEMTKPLPLRNRFSYAANNLSNGGISFIHTTSPLRVNPLILLVAKNLTKVSVMLAGRGFRKWWQALPKHKRALFFTHLHTHNWKYLASLSVVGGSIYYLYESHTVVSPYTNRKKFVILDDSQIAEISDFNFKDEIEQFKDFILPQNHPKVTRLKKICQKLFRGNPTIPHLYSKFWTLYVVDLPEENCIVYPSGQIVMFSGMMELADNDDQLAIVLAHEMSHVILEHHVERLSHASLIDVLMLVPLAMIWAFLPNDGIAAVTHWFFDRVVNILVNLPFSRNLEGEADSVGLFLAASACFDIREASAFWGRLDVLDGMRNKKDNKLEPIKYLSTHPSHCDRQAHLDELMKTALETRESLKCPKLNTIDPRTSVKILQEQIKRAAVV